MEKIIVKRQRLLKYVRAFGSKYLRDRLLRRDRLYTSQAIRSPVKYFYWALEDMPRIFPKQWQYIDGFAALTQMPTVSPLTAATAFFDLTMDEASHLFLPNLQIESIGRVLNEDATPDEFIDNTYRLIESFEAINTEKQFRPKNKIKHEKYAA